MHQRANSVGLTNQLITRSNNGHVSYFGNATWEDSVKQASLDFMHPIMCGTVSSVDDVAMTTATVQIMPNPSSADMFLELETTDDLTVEMFDLNGRLVETWKQVRSSFTISKGTKKGMYILRVSGNDYLSISKIIWN